MSRITKINNITTHPAAAPTCFAGLAKSPKFQHTDSELNSYSTYIYM